jgi:DNA-binding LytR/AlgR family response regulator
VTEPADSEPGHRLHLLAVDDEPPALTDLAWMLGQDPRVGSVRTAEDGAAALRALQEETFDAVFLDIRMPSLDGMDLARVLGRFAAPPPVVFVTAYEDFAVDAFDLRAVDYVLKPVRPERLAEAVRRVVADLSPARLPEDEEETLAVELGGVTRFVRRSEVRFVEAHGDYARLHTPTGSHLVRVALSALEERWQEVGFVRIHRRYLVAERDIVEVRTEGGRYSVRLSDGTVLPVARRHTRDVRERLLEPARPARSDRQREGP